MYRFEVTATVKSDVEGVVGRPIFYTDTGKYYIDSPNDEKVIHYYDSNGDMQSKTLDDICQDLYSSGFSNNSTQHDMPVEITEVHVAGQPPFADKTTNDGAKLFKRVHGVRTTLSGDTTVELIVPYTACKITGVEILWANAGLQADLKVYDTSTGTISSTLAATGYTAIPRLMLNQFGFGVGISANYHEEVSKYDADLISDMKLEVILLNPNGHTNEICINFILHELK